ncbi:MAG: peptidylprolyl isomerase [Candidatus Cloacimonadia bacterium]
MKYSFIHKLSYSILILSTVLLLQSCGKKGAKDSEIVAKVNNDVLTLQSLHSLNDDSEIGFNGKSQQKVIEDWIKLTVLAQEAQLLGLDKQEEIQNKIKYAEKKILANVYLSQVIDNIEVGEKELFNYYQIHKSRYTGDVETYRIQRILVDTNDEADSLSAAINDKLITFAEAARQFSKESIGRNSGFVDFLTPEEIGPLWDKLEKAGQFRWIKERANNGYYLVRFTERRNRKMDRPFTEVRDILKEEIIEEKKKDAIEQAVDRLINKAEITRTK